MDQATRARIAADQLVCLKQLKRGATPPGVLDQHTVEHTVEDAHLKYLGHIEYNLEFHFPAYWHHRRPSSRKLASMFARFEHETDPFANLEPIFETLLADVRRLKRSAPWHDLLLIERALAWSRIARKIDDEPESFAPQIRAARRPKSRMADHDGVFFVWLETDVIANFGYPGRDPRLATELDKPFCVAIYRRPRTNKPELVWFE